MTQELHLENAVRAGRFTLLFYRARYLISGLKFADVTWKSAARALSHRLEDGARRLAGRAALATLTTNLRRDG